MMSAERNLGVDLHSSAMDCHCLEHITSLELIYSSRGMKWLSIGARLIYVRLYKWDWKFIHEEHGTTKVVMCFIHLVLICIAIQKHNFKAW